MLIAGQWYNKTLADTNRWQNDVTDRIASKSAKVLEHVEQCQAQCNSRKSNDLPQHHQSDSERGLVGIAKCFVVPKVGSYYPRTYTNLQFPNQPRPFPANFKLKL